MRIQEALPTRQAALASLASCGTAMVTSMVWWGSRNSARIRSIETQLDRTEACIVGKSTFQTFVDIRYVLTSAVPTYHHAKTGQERARLTSTRATQRNFHSLEALLATSGKAATTIMRMLILVLQRDLLPRPTMALEAIPNTLDLAA